MKRLIQNVVGILAVLLACAPLQADFGLVENFESMATGSPDGRACTGVMGGIWDTEIEGTGNITIGDNSGSRNVTVIGHSSGGVARAVGFNGINNTIDEGETGKVFFRLMLRSASLVPRTYMGLISDASDNPMNTTNADNPMSIPAGFGLLDNGSGGLKIVKTDGTTVLKPDVVRGQWYNFWIVADNEADTFDLYLSAAKGPGGEATLPSPENLVERNIPFGVATTAPLTGMIFTNITGTGQAERIYIDDIYWDGDQGLYTPKKARNPSPADKETDVPRDVVLKWKAGAYAATHDVYFGANFADVSQATSTADPNGVYKGRQDANIYTLPTRLEFSKTYYWRVDEVNAPPDLTIYKGAVWQFTAEPVAYPIAGGNITATASSSHSADMGPEKTINGSGLSANDLHSIEATDMWLSGIDPLGAWIEFQFDKIYKLHQMWVWNSNQMVESLIGFGCKDVSIEYSVNGTDYATLGTNHEFARAPGAPDYAHNTNIDFGGVAAKYVRLTVHSNWGALLQFGLSEVRFFYIPVYAREPSPASGAKDVDPAVTLSWRAGRDAVQHDVYLSSDQQAVIDGTAPVTNIAKTSYGPLSLDLSMTYYWKINEVNLAETPTTWDGDLWSFTTSQFLVVDDFESYNDLDTTDPQSNRIFNTWIDGYGTTTNGSIVGYENPPFCEQTIVHSGRQSMPLAYNNTTGAAYSEAECTFTVGQDWTKAGSQTLVLFFRGTEGNTGQLYVKVNGSKVVYSGDAGDIAKVQWQQWNITLATLNVNLQNVNKLSIGIDGNGASGKLYFDDIRLYRLAS